MLVQMDDDLIAALATAIGAEIPGGGGGGSGTEYTEDAAAAANPVGGAVILVRRDTLTASEVSADGDNVAAKATSKGELYVKATDTDALLTTQNGYLDGLETLITAGNALLTTQNGYLDGVEGLLAAATPAGENHIGQVGGTSKVASANFTRPSDTNAYASGDLVANSTTAGSVAAMQFTVGRVNAGTGQIRRARIKKTNTGVTGAVFRLHLYKTDPAAASGISNGDNGAWLTKEAAYLGAMDVTMDRVFSDAAKGLGVPVTGSEITFDCAGGSQLIYGLLEARGAYTPANGETFTVELEVLQD